MDDYFDLNQQSYDWCVRIFDRVKNLLKVRFRLHHEQSQLENGDIFLFNHFARAETFIPQYLIYHHHGGYCRSVASSAFFKDDTRLSRLLLDLGVVPNNHPQLMLLLATDILRGRKIVIFPEGGMVKDRQVIDDKGRYSVYSRSAEQRRAHHTGAARLATGLQIIKSAILHQHVKGNRRILEKWATSLHLGSVQALLEQAEKPVGIVPANITFYPLRINDNFLSRSAERIYKNLSARAVEELVIEGNLFFKETDMDIRLGETILLADTWEWWERFCVNRLASRLENPDQIFDINFFRKTFIRKTLAQGLRKSIANLRDDYMEDIYQEVTVNLSHLAARLIATLMTNDVESISRAKFQTMVYKTIKSIQPNKSIHLHRSLINPGIYRQLLKQESVELDRFLRSATKAELLEVSDDFIRFLPKLISEHEFDQVRLENPIEVYSNEIAPIFPVCRAVDEIVEAETPECDQLDPAHHFDDLKVQFHWDKEIFNQAKHAEINTLQTATENSSPFLLTANKDSKIAVLLTHGFLASPAEIRPLAEKIHALNITVLGTRIRGHGTSPWDLRERSWEQWLESVERGYEVLSSMAEKVLLVGFSTGGVLSLVSASADKPNIAGVCAICAPIKFQNKNMRFVPLMYGANKIVKWLSKYEGVMPFRPTEPENPHINYRHMPIRGLYELTRLVSHAKTAIPKIKCPVSIIQAEQDRVVEPTSANIIYKLLTARKKNLHWIPGSRHGIVYGDVGETNNLVCEFVRQLAHDSGTET
ncbi:MAG: alpha/beta fold hydrolase [Pseudomonadota bacterium]